MKLYWHKFSLIPWRVRIALHEKGLSYEDAITDLFGKPSRQEFLALNPFAQIPVLEDDGLVLAESMAILEYLEEKYPMPALMPEEVEQRAVIRKLMCWSTDYWPPAWKKWMAPRLPEHLAVPWTDDTVQEGRDELCRHLDVIEPYLADNDWLVEEYSLADICYAPLVLALERVDLQSEIASRYGVAAWVARLKTRKAVQETMMP